MLLWQASVHTRRPFAALPRLLSVVSETQTEPTYHHEGRFRQGERHCIFKYTLAGEGRFRRGGREYPVPAGTGFLCVIRDPETAYCYPAEGTAPWTFVYASFSGKPARDLSRELTERWGPLYRLPRRGRLVRRLEAFERHDGLAREMTASESSAFVTELLLALAASREGAPRQAGHADLVRRARAVVEGNLERNLNASDLAVLLGVSREHLSRVFRTETGMSTYEYILRQRMLLACHLLKEGDLANKEVAARLGYETYPHFSRTFRRVIGMAPGRFRTVGSMPLA